MGLKSERDQKNQDLLAMYQQYLREYPNDVHARFRLGEIGLAMENYPDALEMFKAASRLDPNHKWALFRAGQAAALSGLQLEFGRRCLLTCLQRIESAEDPSPNQIYQLLSDIDTQFSKDAAAKGQQKP